MSKFQAKEFLELKSTWYKQLKSEGFEDIEQEDGNLKFWNALYVRKQLNFTKIVAREEYYRLAGHFLHDHKFDTEVHKTIWEMHSNGISIRDITKKLDKPSYRLNTVKVNRLLQKFAKQMMLDYSPKNVDNE